MWVSVHGRLVLPVLPRFFPFTAPAFAAEKLPEIVSTGPEFVVKIRMCRLWHPTVHQTHRELTGVLPTGLLRPEAELWGPRESHHQRGFWFRASRMARASKLLQAV